MRAESKRTSSHRLLTKMANPGIAAVTEKRCLRCGALIELRARKRSRFCSEECYWTTQRQTSRERSLALRVTKSKAESTASKEIILNDGYVSLVDLQDFDRVNQFKWSVDRGDDEILYAVRNLGPDGEYRIIQLHRFILDAPPGVLVDHRNLDGLDNRRSNLRFCSRSQNACNQKLLRCDNTSGFRGVSYSKTMRRWLAFITVNQVMLRLGYFESKEQA